ncbi:MAG: rhodanese-like domain-containing protein, partial [Bacteroidota bacterium]
FSGDTLFLGDVGRPDLAQKAASMTQEDLAGLLYDSLRNKIMPLADDIIVYPAHGAGSACGKNMMNATQDKLGNQKQMNYALRADMTKEEFIQEVTDGLQPPPAYFPLNVQMNKEGYESIDKVLSDGNLALSADAFEAAANETGAVVLDVRNREDYIKSHIPRSIFIGLDGSFAPWVGALIKDVKQEILLVVDENKVEEAITRLARVGFDNTLGYLKGGLEAWVAAGKETDHLPTETAGEFEKEFAAGDIQVLDVRKPGEYALEHVDQAYHAPLSLLNDHLASISKDKTVYMYCAGGYRSVIAASILKSRGIHNLVNIKTGYKGIVETEVPRNKQVAAGN